ncbi:hypothetical protein A0126_18795 (plasmid) [Exiguobacterium sp. N4-1P]|uniref:hypothetical protein n=1 Tax=Exiguobacterium sp. N4-1P TaxID=2051906 RepID=UPI000B587CD8|nr:hypothetical protein [Exiguobacterium sp. N4-1P]ASI36864.1 hypothetical protein A0126_15115 [Exiguobacterium sp. N4-1P]ASI37637.1 hypothetical protein A0126_18795 [Exiguobacterium sp. N4-1P]
MKNIINRFISKLVSLELPRIFDAAIVHTFEKYGSVVKCPKTLLEQRMIYADIPVLCLNRNRNNPDLRSTQRRRSAWS